MNDQTVSIDQTPPPRIPPHLLNILLNQKLPAQVCSSSLHCIQMISSH